MYYRIVSRYARCSLIQFRQDAAFGVLYLGVPHRCSSRLSAAQLVAHIG